MEPADRLAAYLAGDLDPADASALEEELAGDPALRARLSAMRRADGALLALRSPAPPPGFEERLREALDPVVAAELGMQTETSSPSAAGTFDELAQRREQQRSRRWIPALAGVAAAAAAVAVIGNLDLGSGSDSAGVEDMAVDDADAGADMDAAEMFSLDDADDADGAEDPGGPTIVSSDRLLEQADIDALLDAPELELVVAQGYSGGAGEQLAQRWSLDLGAAPPGDVATLEGQTTEEAEAPAEDSDEPTDTADEPVTLDDAAGRALSDVESADISRCLSRLTDPDDTHRAIPAYVELGRYEGDEVIVYGLVSEDPATGAFTRIELWVAGRDDCEPRYLRQR